jgi:Fic family protein
MPWNWQNPDWPNFSWNASQISAAEVKFLLRTGIVTGTVKHLSESEHNQFIVDSLSGEAVTTSEIEGEILNRASVQSSIQRQLGLIADKRRVKPAEQGIAEMMVDLYRSSSEPVSNEMLFRWHHMVSSGRTDLRDVGKYRTSPEPMQVVSGPVGKTKVHFQAPPANRIPTEMRRFLEFFNRTESRGVAPLPALTRAGIVHLYFESIHPFEDGNGRIGRALAEKALAQGFERTSPIALATTILSHQKSYYDALEKAHKENEITKWLAWFGGIVLEAQHRTIGQVEFLVAKTKLLDRLRGHVNDRQEKALLRMLREGPEGFKGGLSASNYGTITGASPATTTRDLADLVEQGGLIRTGERKHTRYALNLP